MFRYLCVNVLGVRAAEQLIMWKWKFGRSKSAWGFFSCVEEPLVFEFPDSFLFSSTLSYSKVSHLGVHSPRLPRQAICIAPILRKFSAKHTSLNSALAFFNPRMLNCLNPKTLLIQPLGGSAIHLRFL